MIRKIISFYVEGFRGMTVGKTLWLIILIKLFIFFVIFRIFFFSDFLGTRYDTEQEKSDYVTDQLLTKPK